MVEDLNKLRKQIDDIDDKILELLNKRAKIVIEVGKTKSAGSLDFYVPEREKRIYERLINSNSGPFPTESLKAVFREIISASLSLEQPIRVAYLGPKATFTHQACTELFGFSAKYVSVNSIGEVFDEVERGRVDYGVVPIENSTEGVVNHTLDMFVDSDLKICAEISLEISHHLLSKSDNIGNIKKLYSHPHAIAQCRTWIDNNMPNIPVFEVSSTSKAAQLASEDSSSAAIASELASLLYDLKIVRRKIEDNVNNFTRFLVTGNKIVSRTGTDKTSIMFSIKDRVGALYEMLKPFASHQVNLTKIESRPSKKKAWEYLFYIDVEGHIEDKKVAKAIEELREKCIFLKILGSYPKNS